MLEVVAPADGVLSEVLKNEGDTVLSAELIARLDDSAKAGASTPTKAAAGNGSDAGAAKASAAMSSSEQKIAPAARKLIDENRLDAGKIAATGKGGLITKEDVVSYLGAQPAIAAPVAAAPAPIATAVVPDLVIGERVEKEYR